MRQLTLPEAQQALDAANGEAASLKSELDKFETRLRDMSSRATSAREEQLAEKQALDALENPDNARGWGGPDHPRCAPFVACSASARPRGEIQALWSRS